MPKPRGMSGVLGVGLLLLAGLLAACAGGRGGTASASATATNASISPSGISASRGISGSRDAKGVRFATVNVRVPSALAREPFQIPRTLMVPAGWTAQVWARIPGARFAAWTRQRQLLVSTQGGDVMALTRGPGSGDPAHVKVLISGLTSPQGMAFDVFKGTHVLYVAETNQVDRYLWRSNGTVGKRTIIVRDLPDTDPSGDDVHRAKTLVAGPDHTIYVTVGSASNATPPNPHQFPQRATIVAFRPNGSHLHVFASGIRNGEGLSFAPDGSLWVAVNERDEIPYPFHRSFEGAAEAFGEVISAYVNEHPPDEIARLTPGRNLGWPFCNPDPDVDPGVADTALNYARMPFDDDAQTNPSGQALNCSKLTPIDRGLPAHSAPLGFNFLEHSALSAPWSNGAAVAVHGSWDRGPPRPPAVLWLPWSRSARTLGEPITLISGFQSSAGERWGRPADAVPGPDGALYVTDDDAGAVYRIGPPAR